MLASAGFQRGWSVPDAGCGNGAYVPLIQQHVGPTGRVVALDFDVVNAELVSRVTRAPAAVGSIRDQLQNRVEGPILKRGPLRTSVDSDGAKRAERFNGSSPSLQSKNGLAGRRKISCFARSQSP